MSCSICGENGHNSRTCPNKDSGAVIQRPSHALWLKIDGITEEEGDNLLKSVIDAKREIAPHGRATFAKGSRRELPSEINDALKLLNDSSNE